MPSVDPSDMLNFIPPHAHHVLSQEESWKSVPGFPGYEVSDRGRAKSYWERSKISGLGPNQMRIGENPFLLKPNVRKRSGHFYYGLCRGDGKVHVFSAARLVLMTFVRLPVGDEEARHVIDPTPANNCLYNLAWGTPSQNVIDKVLHGNHPMVNLTSDDILVIKKELAAGTKGIDLAKRYGVTHATISHIKNGKTWAHVQVQQGDRDVFKSDWRDS